MAAEGDGEQEEDMDIEKVQRIMDRSGVNQQVIIARTLIDFRKQYIAS